jgi:hypothetical protein
MAYVKRKHRKRFTIDELATYFQVNRHTMSKYLREARVDLSSVADTLAFIVSMSDRMIIGIAVEQEQVKIGMN